MDDLEEVFVGAETVRTLMWVAIGIGVLFIGVLFYDFFKRRKHKHRYQSHRGGPGRVLTRPFRRAHEFCRGVKELYRQRARSRQFEHRKHGRTHRRGSRQHNSSPL